MQITRRLTIPLAFFCALAVPVSPHAQGTDDQGWSELTAGMEKMHRAMGAITPTGDIDADFVRLMIPHHQAAIDMAKTELLLGKNPQLRRLAQEIITDQQSEIDLMNLWLKKHAPEPKDAGKLAEPGRKEK